MVYPATETFVAYTDLPRAYEAGRSLGEQINEAFRGEKPSAVMLFVSPGYEASVIAASAIETCTPETLVGCSSAGEFTTHMQGEGRACAIAFRSSELKFASGMSRGISTDRQAAAKAIVSSFRGVDSVLPISRCGLHGPGDRHNAFGHRKRRNARDPGDQGSRRDGDGAG